MIEEVQVQERLVRVETKLDVLLADLGPRHTDHETRIRVLTNDLAVLKTKVALVSGAFGTAAGVVTSLIAQLIST